MRSVSVLVLLSLLFLPIAPSPSAYAGDTTGLVAEYFLDEESGTRVDETANNNDLTDNNTVLFASGQFGNAADFELANSEYLSITDAAQTGLDITGDHTMGCWWNPETITGSKWLINKIGSSDFNGYGIFMPSTGDISVRIQAATASSIKGSAIFAVSTWDHVVYTFDDSDNELEVFDQGTSCCTAGNSATLTNNANNFEIGRLGDNSDFYDGLADECFVFSRELTGAEITDIADNGLAAFVSPPFPPRAILMNVSVGFSNLLMNKLYYYNLVYEYRKKMMKRGDNLVPSIPAWMRIFEVPEALAEISAAVTTAVTTEWDKKKQVATQPDGKYQQVLKHVIDEVTYETHVYDGPQGVGYIQIACKMDAGKEMCKEREFGPENRNLNINWKEKKRIGA